MKAAKGFMLLESVLITTLSSILLIGAFNSYKESMLTLQHKLWLEEAIFLAEQASVLEDSASNANLNIHKLAPIAINSQSYLKEVHIKRNEKILFSMVEIE